MSNIPTWNSEEQLAAIRSEFKGHSPSEKFDGAGIWSMTGRVIMNMLETVDRSVSSVNVAASSVHKLALTADGEIETWAIDTRMRSKKETHDLMKQLEELE